VLEVGGVLAGACGGDDRAEAAGALLVVLVGGLLLLLVGVGSAGGSACCYSTGWVEKGEWDDARAGPASAASCLGVGLGVLWVLVMVTVVGGGAGGR
jgi:hypothetical protein